MAHLLGLDSVRVEFPTGVVLDGVSLGIDRGDRIGVVGRNGAGKSTLLRLLAGRLPPDAGRATMRRRTTVALLDQGDGLDPARMVGTTVVGGAAAHEWAADARTRDVVRGLLPGVPWDAAVGDLSGGQRRRVALAAVLAGDHDVVCLDEPTNHLDLEGVTWLAAHVRSRWPADAGALLVVTHDRWFLDEVCTTTWEVHDRTVEAFEGGYAAYVLARVERDRTAAAAEAKRRNLMRKELAWLRRGPPARTRKPKFRVDAANALIADEPPPRDPLELVRLATARLGRDVVDVVGASVTLGEREVLRDVDWHIRAGERTGILGANGAGKTTLLGLVTGAVAPTSGEVRRGSTVRVASLAQEGGPLGARAGERVRDVVRDVRRPAYLAGARELTPAQLLERLGFTNAHLAMSVGELSGGQRRRLQLLLVLLDEPNVLVLDEPTNDLDTDMLAEIEDLLDPWPGTLLVVSHDRWFVERVTDQQYAVIDGRLRHLPGGVEQYLELSRLAGPPAAGVPPSRAAGPRDGAVRRAATRELASIERRLEKLPHRIAAVHEQLAAHDQSDYAGLMTHVEALDELKAEQMALESRWLELSEQLESGP